MEKFLHSAVFAARRELAKKRKHPRARFSLSSPRTTLAKNQLNRSISHRFLVRIKSVKHFKTRVFLSYLIFHTKGNRSGSEEEKNLKKSYCWKDGITSRRVAAKLLRLLAINLVGRAVSAVDLSALCTRLEIGRCPDSICEIKENI